MEICICKKKRYNIHRIMNEKKDIVTLCIYIFMHRLTIKYIGDNFSIC